MNAARFAPYREAAANEIYHLLFCDDARAFAPRDREPAPWQRTLFLDRPDAEAIRAVATDTALDARVRLLACRRLAQDGEAPAPGAKDLLGVVVEVALDAGLDTLAAYADGSVRYINHTGAMSIFEGRSDALAPAVDRLFSASREVVARIGPWDKPRLAPPERGRVRLSFLVTDGLYFGDGPMSQFQRDPLAGPVIASASALLTQVVDHTARR